LVALSEEALQSADTALMALGAVLAVVAFVRGYPRLAGPRLGEPGAEQAAAPAPAMLPPETLVLPMVVYLAMFFVGNALLARWIKPLPPAVGATAPPLDLAALLANNLALLAGGIACWVVGRKAVPASGRSLFFRPGQVAADIARGAGGALVAIALCQGMLWLTCRVIVMFSPEYVFPEHGVIEALRDTERPAWLPLTLWVGVAGITPVAEELFFRGLLLTALQRALRSRWSAVLGAAVLFGMAHSSQPQVVPALALFGVILGILYIRTGALAAPIVAHALFNAKTLLWEALRTVH